MLSNWFLDGLVSTARSVVSTTAELLVDGDATDSAEFKYRIVLADDQAHAIAIAEEEEEINQDWKWLEDNVLPKFTEADLSRLIHSSILLHYVFYA